MVRCTRSVLLLAAAYFAQVSAGAQDYYTVSPDSNSTATGGFNRLDAATGAFTAKHMSMTGGTIQNGTALARHPTTGQLFATVRTVLYGNNHVLVTLCPATGRATSAGPTGNRFAGLTFDGSGVLYGVTGDGAPTPEALFRIDTQTGSTTFLRSLGAGGAGEAIVFNPDDGLIYHWSGGVVTGIMETVDPITLAVSSVPRSGLNYDSPLGAAYVGGGEFLLTTLSYELVSVQVSGFAASAGATTTVYHRGIVPVLSVGGPGTPVCTPAIQNSTGSPGTIFAAGSGLAGAPLGLTASCMPEGEFAYFLAGRTQGLVVSPGGSQGVLCIGSGFARFVGQVGAVSGGLYSRTVDTSAIPFSNGGPQPVLPGETLFFTCWYRDQNPAPTSNFTDAVGVVFH